MLDKVSLHGPQADRRPSPDGEPMLTVTVTRHETADVLSVAGEVDAWTAGELDSAVSDVLADVRPARSVVVIDLDRVEFLAAAGLHVLESAHHRCGENLELRLVATGAVILRVLRLFYLDREPPIYPSLKDATTC
jgi:anti-anti-sigma factor